jgi:hypothetical protein
MANFTLTDTSNMNMRQLETTDADSADNFNLLFGQVMNNEYHIQNRLDNSYLPVSILGNEYILDLSQNLNFTITTVDTNNDGIFLTNVPTFSTNILSVVIVMNYTEASTFIYPVGTVWAAGAPTFTVGSKYVLIFESFLNSGTTWSASYSLAWF